MVDLDIFPTILSLSWQPHVTEQHKSPQASCSKYPFIFHKHNSKYILTENYSKRHYSSWSVQLSSPNLPAPQKKNASERKAKLSAILSNLCPHKIQYSFNKKWDLHVFDITLKQPRIILPIKRAQI